MYVNAAFEQQTSYARSEAAGKALRSFLRSGPDPDVIMPNMNGRQLAEEVTARMPELEVLFMSGYSGEIIARQGVLPRDIHLIDKPFGAQALAEAIDAALSSTI